MGSPAKSDFLELNMQPNPNPPPIDRYRAIFDQMPDGLFIFDERFLLVDVNRAGAALLGYTVDEMQGLPLEALLQSPEEVTLPEYTLPDLTTLAPFERVVRRKDGGTLPVEVALLWVMPTQAGAPRYLQVCFRDLQPLKESQRQKLELAIERERLRILQTFIGNVSHDLRTPLASIKTSIYLLERTAQTSPERFAHYLNIITDSAERLQRIINSQLDILREQNIPAGQIPDAAPLDVNVLIRQVLKDGYGLLIQKNQGVHVALSSNIPAIVGNAERLQRGIHSVLSNACHFTPVGGKIGVSSHCDATHAFVSITDNSRGFSEQEIDYLLDSLYTEHPMRSDVSSSLELIVARRAVEAHGGQFLVESIPDGGNTFTMMLPLQLG